MKLSRPLADCLHGSQVPHLYLVGGAVRDWMLGRPVADYDVVVFGDPARLARKLARARGLHPFRLGKGDMAVYRVVDGKTIYDFASLQGTCLEDDLKRRDFTINAMAYDLTSRSVIDPLGGRRDLQSRRIAVVSQAALKSDPLRMLRAFRLAAGLGFHIAPQTAEWIREAAWRIGESAPERVTAELFRLLAVSPSTPYVRQAVNTGLLTRVIPEMGACSGCGQNAYHRGDVLAHSLDTYEALEWVLSDLHRLWPDCVEPDCIRPNCVQVVAAYLAAKQRRTLLKWTALLHDLGKPATRRRDRSGRLRFIGHEIAGARIAEAITARLRMSNQQSAYIVRMVKGHLYFPHLFRAHEKGALTSKAILRFIRKYGEDIIGLVILGVADQAAKSPSVQASVERFIAFGHMVLARYVGDVRPKMETPRLLTGHDLIRHFHMKPSKLIGKVLNRIEEARLEGHIHTRGEAIRLAGRLLNMEGDAGIEPATPSSGGLCSIR